MGQLATRHLHHLVGVLQAEHGRACQGWQGEWEVERGDPDRKLRSPVGSQIGHRSLNPGKLGTPGRGLTAKALRERVGKQYKGTQRTRKAVHGECSVELAKWTFLVISLCREPDEAKVSATGRDAASLTQSRGVRRETPGSSTDLQAQARGDKSLSEKREAREGVYRVVLRDPRDRVRAALPEPQSPAVELHTRRDHTWMRRHHERTDKLSRCVLFA
jgi:hypothetical protein